MIKIKKYLIVSGVALLLLSAGAGVKSFADSV